jgi:anti-anti-sigma factor
VPVVEVLVTEQLDPADLSRLRTVLDEALQVSPVEVVVDVSRCPVMGAGAIGLLLDIHRRLRRAGGRLTLRSPSPRLRRNLELARVDRVLLVTPETVADGGSAAATESAVDVRVVRQIGEE